jgi:ribonuclease J
LTGYHIGRLETALGSPRSGRSEGLPEIVSRGFMPTEDRIPEARQLVLRTLESSTVEERGDWHVMQTQRRPLIMPVILEV